MFFVRELLNVKTFFFTGISNIKFAKVDLKTIELNMMMRLAVRPTGKWKILLRIA
jgi:hypothetical protein